MPKTAKVAGGITCAVICGIGLLLAVILIPVSIKDVGQEDIAIKYHQISRELDDEVFGEGKYLVQPGEVMLTFLRRFVTVEFSGGTAVSCLTRDGLETTLDITFQYQIIKDKLPEIQEKFAEQGNLDEFVKLQARDKFRTACSEFSAEEFYTNRTQVNDKLREILEKRFEDIDPGVEARNVQLRNIDLPTSFSAAIEAKNLALADREQAINERPLQLTQALTELERAERDRDIALINADAQAQVVVIQATEKAEGITRTWQEQAAALKNIKDEMQLSGPDFLDAYLVPFAIEMAEQPIVGIPRGETAP